MIVWVVETGIPASDVPINVSAAPDSAQKPLNGLSFVIRLPIVRTMRQPPVSVPRAMAAWAVRMIQTGISLRSDRYMKWKRDEVSAKTAFDATSRPAMMPIVFCASLAPCASEYVAAEASCARRNQRSTDP